MSVSKWLDDLRGALAIDSSIATGTTEYVHFLTEKASEMGLGCAIAPYHFKDIEFHNLYITSDSRAKDEIEYLFVNPLDTDNPGPFRSWYEMDQDPFDSMIKESKLYGLGANSGKLNTLLQLKVLNEIPNLDRKPVGILATYGRDLRSYGVLKFLKENRAKIKNIVIGFPTSNQVVSAQAGRIRMRISLPFSESEKKLRLAHDEIENSSSQSQYFNFKESTSALSPWKRNTISQSLEYLTNLPEQIIILDLQGGKDLSSEPRSTLLEFDLVNHVDDPMSVKLRKLYSHLNELHTEFEKSTNRNYEPHCPQINFGRVICDLDQIEIYGECVFPPGLATEISEKWMEGFKNYISQLGGGSKVLSQRYPYMYEGKESFLSELHQVSGQVKAKALAYTTEADLFKLAGFNPIIYGAGDLERLSTANEFVELEALDKAQDFYKSLISAK